MNVERDQLAEGTAWITPDGILFKGALYSCRRAIREGWFTQAGTDGGQSSIQVLYDAEAEQHAAIYIDSEFYSEEFLCYMLPVKVKPELAAAYQEQLRKLRDERKKLLGDS